LQWTFKAKTITIDDITLPVIASTIFKNASTLHMQKLNNSPAKEPISTQCTNKCATRMLDNIIIRSPVNCQRQMQASQCRLSKKLLQQLINSLTAKSVLAGTKLILFGRYVLNICVGIVRYFLRKTKTRRAKIYLLTQCTNRQILYDIN
jgi:hypothetical protein